MVLTRHSLNVSTTPLRQWSFWQCLPFSWTTLRYKHCLHPINVMGVVDTFGHSHPSPFCQQGLDVCALLVLPPSKSNDKSQKHHRFIIRQTSGSPDRWNSNFLLIWLLDFLKTQCVFANPTYVNRLEKHCTAVWQSNTATYDNRKKGQLVTKLLGWAGHICSVAHPK